MTFVRCDAEIIVGGGPGRAWARPSRASRAGRRDHVLQLGRVGHVAAESREKRLRLRDQAGRLCTPTIRSISRAARTSALSAIPGMEAWPLRPWTRRRKEHSSSRRSCTGTAAGRRRTPARRPPRSRSSRCGRPPGARGRARRVRRRRRPPRRPWPRRPGRRRARSPSRAKVAIRRGRRGHMPLHVQRAAAPDAAILQEARPRVDRPLRRVGDHRVRVREEQEAGPVAVAGDARDEVCPPGLAGVELARDARVLQVGSSLAAAVSFPGGLTVFRRRSSWRSRWRSSRDVVALCGGDHCDRVDDLFSDAADDRAAELARWPPGCGPSGWRTSWAREGIVGKARRCPGDRGGSASAPPSLRAPGSGKTTLARIVAATTGAAFEELSAVSASVADVRAVLVRATERLGAQGEAHDPLPRRDPPLQQGTAGRPPAGGRVGAPDPDRSDHGEPVLRGELGASLADAGLRAAAALPRGGGRDRAPGRGEPRRRALGRAGRPDRGEGRQRRPLGAEHPRAGLVDCHRRERRGGPLRRGRWPGSGPSSTTRAGTRTTTSRRRSSSPSAAPTPTRRSTTSRPCWRAARTRASSRGG